MATGSRLTQFPDNEDIGKIILNGATARLGKTGDLLTIMSFGLVDKRSAEKTKPRLTVLDDENSIIEERNL